MNRICRRVLGVFAAALLPAGVVTVGSMISPAAHAATHASAHSGSAVTTSSAPPWEPDPDSVGGLVFYNSSGQVITGGSINDSPIAAYVKGTKAIRPGDTKATLFGYLPVEGQSTGQWQGEALGSSTTYPNTSAPAPVNATPLPVETGSAGDLSISELESDFPNDGTGSYAEVYQLRLRTSAADEGLTTTYDSADIVIDTSNATWSVLYTQVLTTTSLAVSPSSKATYGTTLKMTATVSPSNAAGSVEFKDGAKILQTMTVASGSAAYSTKSLPGGVQKVQATFVPASGSGDLASSSAVHDITITPRATSTTLTASATTIRKGEKLTLTAKESPSAGGYAKFYDGTQLLAKVKVSRGTATYSTTSLSVGRHSLKAVFAPSNTKDYKSSTSKVLTVTVTK